MAWQVRYMGQFYDTQNNEILIKVLEEDSTHQAEILTLDANPLTITWPKQEIMSPIYGCGCQVNIINTTSDLEYYTRLFTRPESDFLVTIYRNASIIYTGYLLPEMFEQQLLQNSKLTLPSSSCLNLLDRYTPYSLTLSGNTHLTLISIIKDCLSNIFESEGLLVSTSLTNTSYPDIDDGIVWPDEERPQKTMNIFDKGFVLRDLFIDKDGKIKNSKEVLEMILISFGCRLYQYYGYYVIDRIKDVGITGKTYKQYSLVNDSTGYTFWTGQDTIELSDHIFLNKSARLKYEAGKKIVSVKLNQKIISNLVTTDFKNTSETLLNEDPKNYRWGINSFENKNQYPVKYDYSDSEITQGLLYYTDEYPLMTRLEFGTYDTGTTCELKIEYKTKYKTKKPAIRKKHSLWLNSTFALRLPYNSNKGYYEYVGIIEGIANIIPFNIQNYINWLRYANFNTKEENVTKNGYVINVSEAIDLTPILNSLSSDPNKIVLYLDIYPLQYKYSDFDNWYYDYSIVGDVRVSTTIGKIDNFITGTINKDFSGSYEFEMDIWDTMNLSLANGIYYSPSNPWGLIQNRFTGFTDDYYTYPVSLYHTMISDIIQIYNKPRYILTGDIRLNKFPSANPEFYPPFTRMISLGDVFSYDIFKNDDQTLKKFMLTGLDFNAKENTFRVVLNEFSVDDDFRIPEFDPRPPIVQFFLTPTWMEVDYFSNSETLEIDSVKAWTGTTTDSWITLEDTYGAGTMSTTINIDENTDPESRWGYVIISDGTTSVYCYIGQLGQGMSL